MSDDEDFTRRVREGKGQDTEEYARKYKVGRISSDLARAALLILCAVAALASASMAIAEDRTGNENVYGLDRGRIELAICPGLYRIDWTGTDENGQNNVMYSPGGYPALLTSLGIGVLPHVSVQIGFSVAK